jgi:hypothetical protein
MKISEITDKNKVWKSLLGIDLGFNESYQQILLITDIVLKVKHRSKYPVVIEQIDAFITRANEFLDAKPFDPDDTDIINLQKEVRVMVQTLLTLKDKLV